MFRRNYPRGFQALFGSQALKQSLKTGDVKLDKVRAAEISAKYEEIVTKGSNGIVSHKSAPKPVRVAPVTIPVANPLIGRTRIDCLARTYLNKCSNELRHGHFKSVKFSISLLISLYGARQVGSPTVSQQGGRTIYHY